jgi:hypothetical protein
MITDEANVHGASCLPILVGFKSDGDVCLKGYQLPDGRYH